MITEKDLKIRMADEYEAPDTIKFPVDVFPEPMQDFINQLSHAVNYNQDYTSIAAMYTFAVANGNCHKLRVKNTWLAPTIFWFVAVGESGTMKSHPLQTMINPLEVIDLKSHEKFLTELELWELDNADKKQSNKEPRPTFKQIIIKDYTLEALHLIHVNNKRGLGLYRDEIRAFLNDMNKYRKGSDQQFWLESFNNNKYTINRVSKDPMMIDNININIIGSTQPEVLNEIIRDSNGDGLIERFLFTLNETNIYALPEGDIDAKWIKWWEDNLIIFSERMDYSNPKIIEMDAHAFSSFLTCDKIIVQMQNSDDEVFAIKNYLSKMKTYLPRFALLLCLIDNFFNGTKLEVNQDHISKAWKIIQYFIKSARFTFTETDRNNEMKEVADRFKGNTKKEKIINMHEKGYKNVEIAKLLRTNPGYVSKTLSQI